MNAAALVQSFLAQVPDIGSTPIRDLWPVVMAAIMICGGLFGIWTKGREFSKELSSKASAKDVSNLKEELHKKASKLDVMEAKASLMEFREQQVKTQTQLDGMVKVLDRIERKIEFVMNPRLMRPEDE